MRPLFALAALLLLAAACEGPPGPPGRSLTLPPDDDTFVVEGEEGTTNPHVGADALVLAPDPDPATSRGFMKWELTGFSDVAAAHLHFEAKHTSGLEVVIGVYGSDDDGWDGDTMKWSAQPVVTALLGTADVQTPNESAFDLDVTAYLVDQFLKGPIENEDKTEATFAFILLSTAGTAEVSSLEESDHAPVLRVLPF